MHYIVMVLCLFIFLFLLFCLIFISFLFLCCAVFAYYCVCIFVFCYVYICMSVCLCVWECKCDLLCFGGVCVYITVNVFLFNFTFVFICECFCLSICMSRFVCVYICILVCIHVYLWLKNTCVFHYVDVTRFMCVNVRKCILCVFVIINNCLCDILYIFGLTFINLCVYITFFNQLKIFHICTFAWVCFKCIY